MTSRRFWGCPKKHCAWIFWGDWQTPKKKGLFWAARVNSKNSFATKMGMRQFFFLKAQHLVGLSNKGASFDWATNASTTIDQFRYFPWDPSQRCGLTIHCQFQGSYHRPVTSDLFAAKWMDVSVLCGCFFGGRGLESFFSLLSGIGTIFSKDSLLYVIISKPGWVACWNLRHGHEWDVYFRSTLRFTYVIFHKQHQKNAIKISTLTFALKKLQISSQSPFKKISKSQPIPLFIIQFGAVAYQLPCNQANIAEVVIPKAKVCAGVCWSTNTPAKRPRLIRPY